MPTASTSVFKFFEQCLYASRANVFIVREGQKDKEFHFQNWVGDRLATTGFAFDAGGRNTYPDFHLVALTEGYEVKGLAYPGRWVNYDSNSQVPTGYHNKRTIFYVFGRYPKKPDGNRYPLTDLVVCHGDFLNADHEYVHKNRSVKGFGSYGDIMIRDRKMYVAPTPYGLLDGVAHTQTLILPADVDAPPDYRDVGYLVRREVDELIVGYSFDLRANDIVAEKIANSAAGKEHAFRAWRLSDMVGAPVTLRGIPADVDAEEDEDEE